MSSETATAGLSLHPDHPAALDAAPGYLEAGFSIIPVSPRNKRPLLPWKAYQARRPTRTELIAWRKRWPAAGVGIVCGAVSRLAVLDADCLSRPTASRPERRRPGEPGGAP